MAIAREHDLPRLIRRAQRLVDEGDFAALQFVDPALILELAERDRASHAEVEDLRREKECLVQHIARVHHQGNVLAQDIREWLAVSQRRCHESQRRLERWDEALNTAPTRPPFK